MESIDILTADGAPTGQVALRSVAHSKGLWHRTVHVWIRNRRGELLLQQRSAAKETFPGCWDISAAGHIGAGDSSGNAAIREVFEELGVTVDYTDLQLLFTVQHSYVSPDNAFRDNELSDVYLCTAPVETREITPDPHEVSAVAFHSVPALKKLLAAQPGLFVPHEEEYRRLFEAIEN